MRRSREIATSFQIVCCGEVLSRSTSRESTLGVGRAVAPCTVRMSTARRLARAMSRARCYDEMQAPGKGPLDHAPMPTAGLLAGSLRAGCIRRGWLPPGCLSPDSWRSISGRRLATGSLQAPCNNAPGASPAAAGAMRAPVENGASAGARVDAVAAVQGRSRCPSPHWTDPCELPLPFLRANEAPARRPATCGTNWSKLVRPLPRLPPLAAQIADRVM